MKTIGFLLETYRYADFRDEKRSVAFRYCLESRDVTGEFIVYRKSGTRHTANFKSDRLRHSFGLIGQYMSITIPSADQKIKIKLVINKIVTNNKN